jgi:serine phosphatase RsbU (regulator of sigma subunit)
MHDALRKTRGAAVAVAELDRAQRTVHFAGVGNVSAIILSADGLQKNMVSHNGTVGFEMRKVQQFNYPWPPGSFVVFYSDGLTSHLRLERYNGLLTRHPMLIAGVMYRDFSRQRDDVTAVVLK